MSEIKQLKTNRLRLRSWQQNDIPIFAQLNADAHVMEFFPNPLSRSESDAMVKKIITKMEENGWGFWAIEVCDTSEFIGFVGLNKPENLPFCPCVEVGWRLAKDHWGKGYAVEAAAAALDFAFEELKLRQVVSFTSINNLRSQRVMQKLGMYRESSTFEHPSIPEGHPLKTHVLYRLNSIEWRKTQT